MKKPLALIAAIALSFSALSGCAPSPDTSGTPEPASAGSQSAAQTQEPSDTAGTKKLRFATFQTGDVAADWEQTQLPAYKELTGVEVEHIFVNSPDTLTTYMTWSAAGTLPDAAMLSAYYLNTLITKGMILNLSQYTQENLPDYDFDRYFPRLLDAYKYQGEIYALPSDMDLGLMWYNKDLFDQAGVPYPTNAWTWEDLRENAKKLTGGEGPNKVFGVNCAGAYQTFLWQNGTDILSEDGKECLINSDKSKETFQYLADMIHRDGSSVKPGTDEPLFENGKCAMMLGNGPWYAHYNMADVDFQWGIAAMPKHTVKATTCYGSTFAVFSSSPNQKEAVDFITWFLSDEQQLDRATKFSWYPPSNTVMGMDTFMNDDNIMSMDKAQKQLVMEETAYGDAPVVVESQNEINQIISRELSLLWADEKSVEDALDAIAADVAPLL